jgi:hypothetical protein
VGFWGCAEVHMAPACLKEGRHGLIVPAAAAAWGCLYALSVQLSSLSRQGWVVTAVV